MIYRSKRVVLPVALCIAGVFAFLSLLSPAGAIAGSGGGIYWTNNTNWTTSACYLHSDTILSLNSAMATYRGTDLNGNHTSSCSYSKDLRVHDYNYGDTGWLGIAECVGSTYGSDPNAVCNSHRVRINERNITPYNATVARSVYNLCHEVGHAVGLRHWNNNGTCLQKWLDGGSSTTITNTERNQLNAHY